MAKLKATSFKIGIYIRVSTEEQAENPEGSIKNQEQRLRDFVRIKNMDGGFGEVVEVFSDPGISAKDMNRPALQRMLSKVQSGEINLVMVTDLSRLTRSTKDFGILWEYLAEHGCKFQSLRENFDSTTAAGEMIMFTLANFAQFERKQTAERISHSFLARAKRGLYNGGSVPLGYRVDDSRPGHLLVVPEEAEIVRLIFKAFLKVQTLAQTAIALNEANVKPPRSVKGGGGVRSPHFKIDTVNKVLKQRAYVGVRIFKGKDGVEETKAAWDAIIDETTFDRVQKILAKNKSHKKPHTHVRYPYLLSGFIFCKACGDRLGGKSAHGKKEKVGYYEHTWATKSQSGLSKKVFACEPHRILAKRIEPVVWDEVKKFLLHPEMAKEIFAEAKRKSDDAKAVNEVEKIGRKIAGIDSQIEALAERLAQLPKGIDPRVLFDQLAKLQAAKTDLEAQRTEKAAVAVQDEPVRFDDFSDFTSKFRELLAKEEDPVIRSFVIQAVVARIDVHKDGIEIGFHAGRNHYLREFGDLNGSSGSRPFFVSNPTQGSSAQSNSKKKAIDGPPGGLSQETRFPWRGSKPLKKYFKDRCSNSLINGGR